MVTYGSCRWQKCSAAVHAIRGTLPILLDTSNCAGFPLVTERGLISSTTFVHLNDGLPGNWRASPHLNGLRSGAALGRLGAWSSVSSPNSKPAAESSASAAIRSEERRVGKSGATGGR